MRWYHGGKDALNIEARAAEGIDKEDSARIRSELTKHHPLTAPARGVMVVVDGEPHIKVPPMFCPVDASGNIVQKTAKWTPGSIGLSLVGHGFWVIPPGGSIELDGTIPPNVITDACPHLISEADWLARQPAKAAPATK